MSDPSGERDPGDRDDPDDPGDPDDLGDLSDPGGPDDGPDGGAADRDGGPTVVPEHDPLLLDTMLGGLRSYLRMCGYDAAYAPDRDVEADRAVRELAAAEARRLLTRDRELAAATPGALLVTEREPVEQLRELRDAGVALALAERPTRCGACNGRLVPGERVGERDGRRGDGRPEYVPDGEPAWRCRDCGQWFWKGSHWDDVATTLAEL